MLCQRWWLSTANLKLTQVSISKTKICMKNMYVCMYVEYVWKYLWRGWCALTKTYACTIYQIFFKQICIQEDTSYYWDPSCRLHCSQNLSFYHTWLLPGLRRNRRMGSAVWQASAQCGKCKISLLEWVWLYWAKPGAHSWSFQSQQKGHGDRRQGNVLLVAYFLSANELNHLKTEKWGVKSMEVASCGRKAYSSNTILKSFFSHQCLEADKF